MESFFVLGGVNMKKRIIFDQDNTLVTWTDDSYNTLDTTFKKLEISLTKEDKEIIIEAICEYEDYYDTYTKTNMIDFVNKKLNKTLPNIWLDIWLEELSNRDSILEPNVLEILEYLSQKYEIIVLTNWFTYSQKNNLNKLQVLQYINLVIGTDQVKNKPNKEAFLKACGNVPVEECIMIGDSFKTDILGAYEAGLDAIWYNPKNKQLKQKIKVKQINNLI